MAYVQGNPNETQHRPDYYEKTLNYNNSNCHIALPQAAGEPVRRLGRSVSQPYNLSGRYQLDARYDEGLAGTYSGPIELQCKQSPLPVKGGYSNQPASEHDEGSRNGTFCPNGPSGSGLIACSGGCLRGELHPGSRKLGGPGLHRPIGWDVGMRGPPHQQRSVANDGYSVYQSPRRPPVRNNSSNNRIPTEIPNSRMYGNPKLQSELSIGAQRSKAMPNGVAQLQYTTYNSSSHGIPAPIEADIIDIDHVSDSHWSRESIGAVLDTYCQDPEYYDSVEYFCHSNGSHEAQSGLVEPIPKPNFPTAVISSAHPQLNHLWNGGTMDCALRCQSQPKLRIGYSEGSPYDGVAEVPVEISAISVNNSDQMSRLHANIPTALRVGSLTPPTFETQTGSIPSQRRTSVSDTDRLSVHCPLVVMPDTEISPRLDAHFAHPPPIRPGLLPHGSGHPAPVRQYDAERMTAHPIHATQVQTFTAQDLEHLQNAARLNPSDQKLHLTLAKKLVEAASILTSGDGRADIKTKRKTRENYIFDAHKIIKRLTNSSHPYPDAMFYLASCYGEGQLGLQVDHERAFHLYQSAAKLNHGPSAYRTAVCGELGAGVRKDPQRAMTWYKKAAALGETPAMFKLGMILWKGLLGQPRNLRDGLIWLKRAADQADENNQHALHELGLLYESDGNEIIIPDIHYARELFLRAAELGYSASQFRMGYAYEYGTMGCPIDPRKSIAWYSKASMKGDHEAQLALSGWYLTGSDGIIQQSDTEAYLWARKASERGLAKAEYALGYYTEVGIGVSPNLDEAKRWYYKAASQQHPKAQLRLHELKKGGIIVQRSRERLSRSNVKGKEDDGDCIIM